MLPDVVVWHSGGNDAQNMQVGAQVVPVGSEDWAATYEDRVDELIRAATGRGSRMVWVGLPPIRDERHDGAARAMNSAAARLSRKHSTVRFLDLAPMFAGADGGYAIFAVGPDGTRTRVRQDDGVHLTAEGTEWVADLVYGAILADFGLERPSSP
jgi:hypothetical protein